MDIDIGLQKLSQIQLIREMEYNQFSTFLLTIFINSAAITCPVIVILCIFNIQGNKLCSKNFDTHWEREREKREERREREKAAMRYMEQMWEPFVEQTPHEHQQVCWIIDACNV